MKTLLLLAAIAKFSMSAPNAAPPSRMSAPDDAAILNRFDDAVTVDLACAELAVQRGHSKEVRDFARTLVSEHGMAHQLARDVAAQLDLSLKPASDGARRAEHARVLKALQERPDAAFDVLFLRHEVEYHKELVTLIHDEWIPAAKSGDLGALLSQAAPAFEAHGKMAGELGQRLRPGA